ncbi:MAG: hypothetical protein ACOY5B_10480 [Spirochaetota bacterium]
MEGVNFALKRTDLPGKVVDDVANSAPGNGSIIGRQQVIYTKELPSGPELLAGVANGVISIADLSDGTYVLTVAKPGYESVDIPIQNNSAENGEVQLRPRRGVLSGRVVDQDGNGIPHAALKLKGYHYSYELVAGEMGDFSYALFEDIYNLAVVPNEKYGKHIEKNLKVIEGLHVEKTLQVVRYKSGIALLRLVDKAGRPVTGISTGFRFDAPEKVPNNGIRGATIGFLNGSEKETVALDFDRLLSHNASHTPLSYAQGAFSGKEELPLDKAEFAVQPLPGAATGVTMNTQQFDYGRMLNPVNAESMFADSPEDIFGAEPRDFFSGTTDGSGNLEATGLKPGRYRLTFSKDGMDIGGEGITVDVARGVITDKQIVISGTTMPLSLGIIDEDGAPVPNAVCYIENLPTVGSRTSDSSGQVLFGHINAGDHFLKCSKTNFETLNHKFQVLGSEVRSASDARDEGKVLPVKNLGTFSLRALRTDWQILAISKKRLDDDEIQVLPVNAATLTITPGKESDLSATETPGIPGLYQIRNLRVDRIYTVELLPKDENHGRQKITINPQLHDLTPAGDGLEYLQSHGIDPAATAVSSATVSAAARAFYENIGSVKFRRSDSLMITTTALTVSASLSDITNKPVQGAMVTITTPNTSWKQKTDSDGKVEFRRLTLLPNESFSSWRVTAEKSGYLPVSGTIATGAAPGEYAVVWNAMRKPDFDAAQVEQITRLFGTTFRLDKLQYTTADRRFVLKGKFTFTMENLPTFVNARNFVADADLALRFTNNGTTTDFERALGDLTYYFQTQETSNNVPATGVMSREGIQQVLSAHIPGGDFSKTNMLQNLEQVLSFLLKDKPVNLGKPEGDSGRMSGETSLFQVGEYEARIPAIRLVSNGTVPGTRIEPESFVLKRVVSDADENQRVFPSEIALDNVLFANNGLDFSKVTIKKGARFVLFDLGLGNLAADSEQGSTIALNPATFAITVKGGRHLLPGILRNDRHRLLELPAVFTTAKTTLTADFEFSLFPQSDLNKIDFTIPPGTEPVQLPLTTSLSQYVPKAKVTTSVGLPYHLTKYSYDLRTREISTSGYINIVAAGLKSCTGREFRMGVNKLNLNLLTKGNIFSAIEMSQEPAEFSVFGGMATFEDYDLQIVSNTGWQIQGDVVISWSSDGSCVSSSGASGGLVIKNFTIGYDPTFGFRMLENSYKSIPPNQRLQMRGIGFAVNSVNFEEVNGQTRMTINGPVLISLPFVIVQATNVHWYIGGSFSAEQFLIRVPVLWDSQGYVNMLPTGGVAGGLRMNFVLGQFDLQFVFGSTNWMISLVLPVRTPWLPSGSYASNLRLYVAQRGDNPRDRNGIYILAAWDWELAPPIGKVASIDDFTVLIDTGGLIQLSGKVRALEGKFLSGMNAVGEIRFAPESESHILLRVDLETMPVVSAFVNMETAGANFYIKFKNPTVILIGAGISGTLKLIGGRTAAGVFFGHNADLPPGFTYNHTVKSPDISGNRKLNGLYGLYQPRDWELGFKAGPVSFYKKRTMALMLLASYDPVGIRGGAINNNAIAGDVSFMGVSFGAEMQNLLDFGFNATMGEPAHISVAADWAGRFYIVVPMPDPVPDIDVAVGVEVGATLVFASNGPDMHDIRFNLQKGGKDSVQSPVIPKYNLDVSLTEIGQGFRDLGEGMAAVATNAADLVGGLCPFDLPMEQSCLSCIKAAMNCSGINARLLANKTVDRLGASGINAIVDGLRKNNEPNSAPPAAPTPEPAPDHESEDPLPVADDSTPVDLPSEPDESPSESIEFTFDPDPNPDADPDEPLLTESELAPADTGDESSEPASPEVQPVPQDNMPSTHDADVATITEWVGCLESQPTCRLVKGVAGYYLMALAQGVNGVGAKMMLSVKKCNGKYKQGDRDATCRDMTDEQKKESTKDTRTKTEKLQQDLTRLRQMEIQGEAVTTRMNTLADKQKALAADLKKMLEETKSLQKEVTARMSAEEADAAWKRLPAGKLMAQDYYDILGVAQNANTYQIVQGYKHALENVQRDVERLFKAEPAINPNMSRLQKIKATLLALQKSFAKTLKKTQAKAAAAASVVSDSLSSVRASLSNVGSAIANSIRRKRTGGYELLEEDESSVISEVVMDPDSVSMPEAEVNPEIALQISRVEQAFETLIDPGARKDYDKKIAAQREKAEAERAGDAAKIREQQKRAQQLIEKSNTYLRQWTTLKQTRKLYKKQFKDMFGVLGEKNRIWLWAKTTINLSPLATGRQNRQLVARIKKQVKRLEKRMPPPFLHKAGFAAAYEAKNDKVLSLIRSVLRKAQQDLKVAGKIEEPLTVMQRLKAAGTSAVSSLRDSLENATDRLIENLNQNEFLLAQKVMFIPVGDNVSYMESTGGKLGVAVNYLSGNPSNMAGMFSGVNSTTNRLAVSGNINSINVYSIAAASDGQINLQMRNPSTSTLTYRVELTRDEQCPLVPDPNNRKDWNGKLLKVFAKESEATAGQTVRFQYQNDKFDYICWYSRKVGQIQTVDSATTDRSGKPAANTWYMRQIVILKPGQSLAAQPLLSGLSDDLLNKALEGIQAGIDYVIDYVQKLQQNLVDQYNRNENAYLSLLADAADIEQGYREYIKEGKWSPLLLELSKNPAKRTAFMQAVRRGVDRLRDSCNNTLTLANGALDASQLLFKVIRQNFAEDEIEEMRRLLGKVEQGCSRMSSINDMLLSLEEQYFPRETASLTDLGGLKIRLDDIRFDEANKSIVLTGIHYVAIGGLPQNSLPGQQTIPGRLALPFSYALPMPARYMSQIEALPGELSPMDAVRALVEMVSTTPNPQGILSNLASGDRLLYIGKIRSALKFSSQDLTGMVQELLTAIHPEYHVYGRFFIASLGPYDLFAENFHLRLRGGKYYAEFEKVCLSLERNPVVEHGYPGILPAEILLKAKSTPNGISIDGKVSLIGESGSVNIPQVGIVSMDQETTIEFSMPSTLLTIKKFTVDDRSGNPPQRSDISVNLHPFMLVSTTIPGWNLSAVQQVRQILGVEAELDYIRYNTDANKIEMAGRLLLPQDKLSVGKFVGLIAKPAFPFTWSYEVPKRIYADPTREKALADVLKYIRTRENNGMRGDPEIYTMEEGLRLLEWDGHTHEQLVNDVGQLIFGEAPQSIPLCDKHSLDNMVNLGRIGPFILETTCPVLNTNGTIDGTSIAFAGFRLNFPKAIEVAGFLELPRTIVITRVKADRNGIDLSSARAEVSGLTIRASNLALVDSGKITLDMASATIRINPGKIMLKEPLQSQTVLSNNVLFYDKFAKFIDNKLAEFSLDITLSMEPRMCLKRISFGDYYDALIQSRALALLMDLNNNFSSRNELAADESVEPCGRLNADYREALPRGPKKVIVKVIDQDRKPLNNVDVYVRGNPFGSGESIPKGMLALRSGGAYGKEGANRNDKGKTDASGQYLFELAPGNYNFDVAISGKSFDAVEQTTESFVTEAAPEGASSILSIRTGLSTSYMTKTSGDRWVVGERQWEGQVFRLTIRLIRASESLSTVTVNLNDNPGPGPRMPVSGAFVELRSQDDPNRRYLLPEIAGQPGIYREMIPKDSSYEIAIVASGFKTVGYGFAINHDRDEAYTAAGNPGTIISTATAQVNKTYGLRSTGLTNAKFYLRESNLKPIEGAMVQLKKESRVYTFQERIQNGKSTGIYECATYEDPIAGCPGLLKGVYQLRIIKSGYKAYSGDYENVNVNGSPINRILVIDKENPTTAN